MNGCWRGVKGRVPLPSLAAPGQDSAYRHQMIEIVGESRSAPVSPPVSSSPVRQRQSPGQALPQRLKCHTAGSRGMITALRTPL